jgi:hypothetical protein
MGMEDEGPRVMLHFDTRFTRVKYGHPEYRRVAAALSLTSKRSTALRGRETCDGRRAMSDHNARTYVVGEKGPEHCAFNVSGMVVEPQSEWESEKVVRLKRERSVAAGIRDRLKAEYGEAEKRVTTLDDRIREEKDRR